MTDDCSIFLGIKELKGVNIIHLWKSIHDNADMWFRIDQKGIRRKFESQIQYMMSNLGEIASPRWSALCSAAGWTVYGAVALSWCNGAKLDDVWAGWLTSGFPLKPLPEYERPARFINPALLSNEITAEGINSWALKQNYPDAETYQLAVCATIAALKEPLQFGLPPEKYKTAMPQIAAFLKSRLLQKPSRTPEENELISFWSERIKGTEWDIWEPT